VHESNRRIAYHRTRAAICLGPPPEILANFLLIMPKVLDAESLVTIPTSLTTAKKAWRQRSSFGPGHFGEVCLEHNPCVTTSARAAELAKDQRTHSL